MQAETLELRPLDHHGVFPWTVLRSDSGPWQERKRALIASGIDDLAGRPGVEIFRHGRSGRHHRISGGKSRFCPVLADLMYAWYGVPGGVVYDPFAGGVTRGALAAQHGMRYVGVDLSQMQVESNRQLAERLGLHGVEWMVGDGTDPPPVTGADMVFTCPPYHSLERYSDDPRDLSVMGWDEHLGAIERAARSCWEALADNRFLVWVIGDLRGPDGHLRMLPERTALILAEAGFRPVNHHILVTPVGTMHRMLRRWWTGTRSAGRCHQHVLVMCRGDRRKAVEDMNRAADRLTQTV